MAVYAHGVCGTIGGGHLEWQALAKAQAWLLQGMPGAAMTERLALGPALGQCCGGAVQLRWSALTQAQWPQVQVRLQPARTPVALFGAGHVGQALVRVLAPLPFTVQWFDSREAAFPSDVGHARVHMEHSQPVQAAVPDIAPQALVLVMSFSHTEDLDIVTACLRRQRVHGDLPFIGLIGSATKWALFQRRLQERGFGASEVARITCPIGMPGIDGKEPEVIAVAVAAQLLQQRALQMAQCAEPQGLDAAQ